MKKYNPIVLEAAKLSAIEYITMPNHGDKYVFACTVARNDGTKNSRQLALAIVEREGLLEVIENNRAIDSGFFQIRDGVLKVAKVSETAVRKAFGNRATIVRPDWDEHTYSDLPLDPSPCAGPRARTFEKRVAEFLGAIWVGALRNVQVDGVLKYIDENGNEVKIRFEVKGLGGRLTAFVPSAIDPDIPERG